MPRHDELPDDLPDDGVMLVETKLWQLYFDRAARNRAVEVGNVFVTPSGAPVPYSFSLFETCSNNVAEYEAIVMAL